MSVTIRRANKMYFNFSANKAGFAKIVTFVSLSMCVGGQLVDASVW